MLKQNLTHLKVQQNIARRGKCNNTEVTYKDV